MLKNSVYYWLAGIVVIAGILRFYQLGVNPPSLTWDEAAWGYNAYSLSVSGRDEFGKFLPLAYLESFGDFKPPLYAYASVIPVLLFGLTPFATRFASAFFGTVTVAVVYWLVSELLETDAHKTDKTNRTDMMGLVASALLAISPWHINLSRAAFEANVASFFIITGVWLYLRWARKPSTVLLIFSGVSFVLSLYTFNTARIVAPLLIIVLSARFYKILLAHAVSVAVAGILCVVLSLPFIMFSMTPQAKLRYHEVNIFSDGSIVENANTSMARSARWVCKISGESTCSTKTALDAPLWARIMYNRRIGYVRAYVKHYFDHFNPSFLFIKGDGNPKFSTQDVGQLYLVCAPFIIVGLFQLFKKRIGHWWLVPVWLVIGIVPAATARETPHALRIETTLPTFQIISAYGIVYLYRIVDRLKRVLVTRAFVGIALCAYAGMAVYYLHGYYVHYPVEYSGEWQYGYEEAIGFLKNNPSYKHVVMTTALGRPYIYVLFYTQTDPRLFQQTAVVEREVLGFVHVRSFGTYTFADAPAEVHPSGKTVYIDIPQYVPEKAIVLRIFTLLNGHPVLVAYEI